MEIVKMPCYDCKKITECVVQSQEYGSEAICRGCKKRFAMTMTVDEIKDMDEIKRFDV